MLVTAGSWSATGGPHVAIVVAAAAVGSFASDMIKYAIGRLAGRAMLVRLARRPKGARAVVWIENRMTRSGAAVIVPSYFVPFGALVATLLAGAMRLPVRAVLLASAVGAAVWAALFTMLGYVGGAVTGHPLIGIAFGLVAALAIGLLAGRRTVGSSRAPAPTAGYAGRPVPATSAP